ncbi:MAG: hypothetical protein ACE5ED_03515 [Rhodothalassiaceae bacterium]
MSRRSERHENGTSIRALVEAEITRPQPAAVIAAAQHATAPHGDAVDALLYYGSCLRTGVLADRILDFYVLVADYDSAYDRRWLALANRLLPPNVFYDEMEYADPPRLRSKVNVISTDDFSRRVRADCVNVSIWARFAQPVALVQVRDADMRARIVDAIAEAIGTTLDAARPLASAGDDAAALWSRAFDLTYGAELRSEPPGKGREIYEADAARYDRLFAAWCRETGIATRSDRDGRLRLAESPPASERRRALRAWRRRRWNGKVVSLLRLVKAAFTFSGGIDYLAWKIRRHSGVEITLSAWQRRHPLLAGLLLFLRLKRRGAFR